MREFIISVVAIVLLFIGFGCLYIYIDKPVQAQTEASYQYAMQKKQEFFARIDSIEVRIARLEADTVKGGKK